MEGDSSRDSKDSGGSRSGENRKPGSKRSENKNNDDDGGGALIEDGLDDTLNEVHDLQISNDDDERKELHENDPTGVTVPAGEDGDMIPRKKKEKHPVFDVSQFLPPEAIKRISIKPLKRIRRQMQSRVQPSDKPRGPIAAKVVYIKKPPELVEKENPEEDELEEPKLESGEVPSSSIDRKPAEAVQPLLPSQSKPADLDDDMPPSLLFTDHIDDIIQETRQDEDIDKRLASLISAHRSERLKKLKKVSKARIPNFKFKDSIAFLKKCGIPCPTNDDYVKLRGSHSRWDPDGTVVEYFSPELRTFVPINMRGRYRGCGPADTCMKGLDVGRIPPKRDALEGFVERGRHDSIQKKYDEMSPVAVDEAHLDFLIEIQAFQAETLPIPIFYDMLHLGMQVANESLRILVQEEGYVPNNAIFVSSLEHAEQLRRKIQLYGALGLENLDSKRRGLGEYLPHWLKTRDEIIRSIMKSKDNLHYGNLKRHEDEAREKANTRRDQQETLKGMGDIGATGKSNLSGVGGPATSILSGLPDAVRNVTGRLNKVDTEKH